MATAAKPTTHTISAGRFVAQGMRTNGTVASAAPTRTIGHRPVRRRASLSERNPTDGWVTMPQEWSRPMISPITPAEEK
ncbi:hypothetical protein GCM10009578_028190 [Streptomyces rhizosphaericus]